MSHQLRGVLLCAALCLAAPGARGEGEEGRFSFHPSIRVSAVADDNVFLRDRDREGDIGTWIAPRIEAAYRTRTLGIGAEAGADVRRYALHRRLDDELVTLRGWAEVGVLPGLTLSVSDVYTPQPIRLGLPEDETENLAHTNRLIAKAEYWRELPAGRELELGVQGTRLFSEGFAVDVPTGGGLVAENDFAPDFWEGMVYGEVRSPFGRRTEAFVRTSGRYRTFLEASRLDHTDFSALVGVSTRRVRNLELSVAGGYGLLVYQDQGSVSRFLGEAEARWHLRRGWTLSLEAQNRFTADLTGNDFVETSGRLGVEKRLGERTRATLAVFATRFEEDAFGNGSNLFGGAEAQLARQLTRRMQLVLAYRHWRNGGENEIDDFDQNRVVLSLSYRR